MSDVPPGAPSVANFAERAADCEYCAEGNTPIWRHATQEWVHNIAKGKQYTHTVCRHWWKNRTVANA